MGDVSILDEDHYEGSLLARIKALEARLKKLEREALSGLVEDLGTAGATEDGWIQVEEGAVTGYLRVYSTK